MDKYKDFSREYTELNIKQNILKQDIISELIYISNKEYNYDKLNKLSLDEVYKIYNSYIKSINDNNQLKFPWYNQ